MSTHIDKALIDKVKALELAVLQYVDSICKTHGLKYYLVKGSLLGAVRHKGFIPWDDDIDIAMYREDYNKFTQIVLADKNPKYFLQNMETDANYSRYITKIRVNDTLFMEQRVQNLKMHHGVFIDIFPLDRIKNPNSLTLKLRVAVAAILLRINEIRKGLTNASTQFKTRRNKIIKRVLSFLPISSRFFNRMVDMLYGFNNKSKSATFTTSFACRYGWRKETFPNDVYGEGTQVVFEGKPFNAPEKWDIILKRLYGEAYMDIPPKEKQVSGHHLIKIDLGHYA